ncbi:MAG: Ig-like domain-containing protein, partial [Acidobacteriota bacterium]
VGAAPPELYGEPLAIRLSLGSDAAQRSTHFDHVRLAVIEPPGNVPPAAELAAPAAAELGEVVTLDATALDADGQVAAVRFYADGALIGTDVDAPYALDWTPAVVGTVDLRVEVEDDAGAVTSSAASPLTVGLPPGSGSIAVVNPSFETPFLGDGVVQNDSGVPGWTFSAVGSTYRGIFNPPAASYPEAVGHGTPVGADGAQVAFLFNNGGAPTAHQDLGVGMVGGRLYTLRVAVGHFDPAQPYAPSTYGGYRIELLAGSTVVAVDEDTVTPALHTFADAVVTLDADTVDPALIGQELSIRLAPSAVQAGRSTHFDNVRLDWQLLP